MFSEEGLEAGHGEIGELGVASENLMLRYLDGVSGCEARYLHGHLLTGDIVRKHSHGVIELLGRRDRLIVESSGENIYPQPLEQKVLALSSVNDCFVAARVNNRGHDEAVVIVVPSDPGKLDDPDWVSFLRRTFRHHVVVSEAIPRADDGTVDGAGISEIINQFMETEEV